MRISRFAERLRGRFERLNCRSRNRSVFCYEMLEARFALVGDVYEPNNSLDFVEGLPAGGGFSPNLGLVSDTVLVQRLSMDDADDWYRFETPEVGTSHDFVRIDFVNGLGNLELELWDGNRTKLPSANSNSTNFEQLSLASRPSGVYFVHVFGRGGAENPDYTLTINPPGNSIDDPFEPNDAFGQVTELPAGGVGSSNFGVLSSQKILTNLRLEDSSDWFRMETVAKGTSSNTVRIDFENGRGNLDLELWDDSNHKIPYSNSNATDFEQASLASLNAGVYFVRVLGAAGAANAHYTLTINPPLSPVSGAAEIEVKSNGVDVIDGCLETIDFGQISLNDAGKLRSFRVLNRGEGPLSIGGLTVPTGFSVLDPLASNIAPGEFDDFSVQLNAQSPGTHFGLISFLSNDQDENIFDFAVEGTVTPTTAADSGDVFEANDTFFDVALAAAGEPQSPNFGVVTNRLVIQQLNLLGSEDWYRFETTAEGTKHDFVRIDFVNSAGNLDLELWDDNHNKLPSSNSNSTNNELKSLATLPAGAYFVRVLRGSGQSNPDYTLTIDPPGNSPDDALEPNDTSIQVAIQSPGHLGSANFGVLTEKKVLTNLKLEDAEDWYRFETTATGQSSTNGQDNNVVRIDFNNAIGNLDLELYDDKYNKLPSANSNATNFEQQSLANRLAGVFYIRVRGGAGDASVDYTLTINPPLGVAQPHPEVALSDDGEEIIDGQSEGIGFGEVATNTTSVVKVIRVSNAGVGNLVVGELDVPPGFTVVEPLSPLIAPGAFDTFSVKLDTEVPGTHFGYITFITNDQDENVFDFAVEGTVISTTDTDHGDVFEENDDAWDVEMLPSGSPNSANFGTLTRSLAIPHLVLSDANDWYRFETTATGTKHDFVRIDFLNSQGNLDLELWDENHNRLPSSNSNSTNTEKLSLASKQAGVYFVHVLGGGGAQNPDYTLTIDPPGNSHDDTFEPNDTRWQVAVHTPGATNSPNLGVLSEPYVQDLMLEDADDWYRFETTATGTSGNSVQISFANSQGDLDLELWDDNNNRIPSSNSNSTNTETVSLATLVAGVYYVRVIGGSGDANPNYTLRIIPPSSDLFLSVLVSNSVISEIDGTGASVGSITRTGATTSALVVWLASSDNTEAQVPRSVTIPSGQESVAFSIDAVDDLFLDGTKHVGLTVWATGYASGVGSVSVTDNESSTVYRVVNTNDSGPGSFRRAIENANATLASDTIEFQIPGSGLQSISLRSALPAIESPLRIDGWSQPGFVGVPLIELNGENAGVGSYGLFISAGFSSVRGLVINRFDASGIGLYREGNNQLEGNFIGTDSNGLSARGNRRMGIDVIESANNRIGGSTLAKRNVISGNGIHGIYVHGANASSNIVSGNYIGITLTGTSSLKNLDDGVYLDSAAHGNIVGTDGDGIDDLSEGNVISGNGGDGVQFYGSGTDNNTVAGNIIGLNSSGTAAIANAFAGVVINRGAKNNLVGSDVDGISDPAERNIISGNLTTGIWIAEAGTSGNRVLGNFVGTNLSGDVALPNRFKGITIIQGATDNTVGGVAVGAGNVVSGNEIAGISIENAETVGNVIQGNLVGIAADGLSPLGNTPGAHLGWGIVVVDARNNIIGGTTVGSGNTIANNAGPGIAITGNVAVGNALRQNKVYSNGGPGIDLGDSGVSQNDAGDLDTGNNNLQNFPELQSALGFQDRVVVSGSLSSAPNRTYQVEFFSSPDRTSYVQGRNFLGETTVVTDVQGVGNFSKALLGKFPIGTWISATASDSSNNTSEFSNAIEVQAVLQISVVAESISENGGATTGRVTRNAPDISQPLSIALTSSDVSEATVPAVITIPANQVSVTFAIQSVDDTILDGLQTVRIEAAAIGYVTHAATLNVTDLETLSVQVGQPSMSEQAGKILATVNRNNTDISQPLTVTLVSNDLSEATVPNSVTILVGHSSATFEIDAVDDTLLDGLQTVLITASAVGYESGMRSIQIADAESLTLAFSPDVIAEDGGATTGTVTRSNSDVSQVLVVGVAHDGRQDVTAPISVTIPVGAISKSFLVLATNDLLVGGNKRVSFNATALGYEAGSARLEIVEDDVPLLTLSTDKQSMDEKNGKVTFTVSRNTPPSVDLELTLGSSDSDTAGVPSRLIIPAGQAAASFQVVAIDTNIAEGDRHAEITVSAVGFPDNSQRVTVVDDEIPTLQITLISNAISESSGSTVGKVRRNTPTEHSLLVNLNSSDISEATVPLSIEIPVGALEATFVVTAQADGVVDGNQSLAIQAASDGFASLSAALTVVDVDVWTWTNTVNPLDCDEDNSVSPLDVLVLINELNRNGSYRLPSPSNKPAVFLDADADGFLSPLDVLVVVNHLNSIHGSGEGEAYSTGVERWGEFQLSPEIVDELFANRTQRRHRARRF